MLPIEVGALSWITLGLELRGWDGFENRRQIASYTGLPPGSTEVSAFLCVGRFLLSHLVVTNGAQSKMSAAQYSLASLRCDLCKLKVKGTGGKSPQIAP